ncbi:MAG: sensor histidine kinase [Promethearchaeota archaeon]
MDVYANELLQQIFDNILINAIKYNDNSLVEIHIRISKEMGETGSYIKMEFLDNGLGIQDNQKKVIFKEGYHHLKGSKGMGVGLSLVSEILKSYNGMIFVEDKVKGDYKKGSNFIILLPEAN